MNKIETKSNLNSRQFRLYDYLKNKRLDEWTFQEQIARDLSDLYPATENDFEDFHNSTCRHLIGGDIRAINESDYIHKPILSGARGVKIANEQEFDKYIASNIMSAVNRLKRLKKLSEKADKNGQYRLKLSQYQKEVYEAFLDDDVS